MIFKIVYNNEIHRIRAKISNFDQLIETISARLPNLTKTNLCCDYSDLDGDKVRINCQEDFAILLEELEGQKSVKIFVKEDLNQTLQLPTQVSRSEIVIEEKSETSEKESPKISPKKAESPIKRKEPVLMTFVGYPQEKEVIIMDENEEDISIDKKPKKTVEAPVEKKETAPAEKVEEVETEKPEEYTGRCPYLKKNWGENKDGQEHWGGRGYHGYGRHGGKRGCHGGKGHWHKKRQWWREKFNRKFDEAIQRALPQIAVHVAQILRDDGNATIPAKVLSPMKTQDIPEKQSKVVHHGYVCDGCGISPIVGDCYKCSVLEDFDFCSKCEATKPHPYPFLKLKTPEQRPHVLITAINEPGQKPFNA